MRQPVRAFAIGLFTAGIIMLIGIFYFDDSVRTADDLSIDEMTSSLKEEGYRVVTEEEYIAVSVNNDKTQQKANEAEKPDADQKKDDEQNKDKQNVDKADKSDKAVDDKEKTSKKKDDKEDAKGKGDKKDKDDEKDKDETKTYTININDGVLSSTISDRLEANGIIDNSTKFNLYLTDNGYGEKIQLGKFKVNSDMSFKEIAEAITR